jgi:hypothetical protein
MEAEVIFETTDPDGERLTVYRGPGDGITVEIESDGYKGAILDADQTAALRAALNGTAQ